MALSACDTTTDAAGRELTAHGTAAFPIACYHDDLAAEPVPWHWHEEVEMLIASEGRVLAAAAGTIPYELTCAVSRRVPRVYYKDGREVEKELLLRF